jgi:TatD DNase family protein
MIDSHAHLLHAQYTSAGVGPEALLNEAATAGLTHMIGIATVRAEWAPYVLLAKANPMVRVAAGLHPSHVHEDAPVSVAELTTLAGQPSVVGLGETGLDYYHDGTTHKTLQWAAFEAHAQAAVAAGLPLVIHSRAAEADTLAVLKNYPGLSFVLHCFTGSAWLAEQALGLGGYVSFSGIVTFKNSHDLRAIAASIPENKLLIETDAPYLAPEPVRGKLCTPAMVAHTCAALARVRGTTATALAAQTAANTRALFTRL